MDQHKPRYKSCNILAIEERVDAIREYERNPVYQRIAEKFSCSPKQIKNIIANKEAVLSNYKASTTDQSGLSRKNRRCEKIAFLVKVIYEQIERAVYHGFPINEEFVLKQVLKIKESIAIENFYPKIEWVQKFMFTFNITEMNTENLRKTMVFNKPKQTSLNYIDIIQFIRQEEKVEREKHRYPWSENSNRVNEMNLRFLSTNNTIFGNNISSEKIVVDNTINNDYKQFDESPKNVSSKKRKLSMEVDEEPITVENLYETNDKRQDLDAKIFKDILQHIKALEDIALLKDNFRAIGLLQQVEQAFKNPPQDEDFYT